MNLENTPLEAAGSEEDGERLSSVVIFAPRGRDAEVAANLLKKEGYDSLSVGSLAALVPHI